MQVSKSSYLSLSELTKDKNNNVVFSTRRLISCEPDKSDIFYTVKPGDEIEFISYDNYGTVDYWWCLADINGIDHPISIAIGTKIRIPTRERIEQAIKDARY